MRTLVILATLGAVACSQSKGTAQKEKAESKPAAEAPKAEDAPKKAPPKDPGVDAPKPEGDPYAAPENVAAPPEDAKTTDSGLAYKVLRSAEDGDRPGSNDQVTVHYTGWTTDGKMFDSSHKRGRPATFGLTQVIAGWTEGLQLMKVGEKARLWIPEKLAYQGKPGRPQGMLVFDVELLKITAAPEVPKDVAAPPKDAKKTDSGLAYKVLEAGSGKSPGPDSRVEVHYSGWTTDGKMFDSSVARGRTAKFPLNGVIPGWTEGLQLMKEGATYRLWIPSKLAYENRPGRPQGMLVFDVELVKVLDE